MGRASSLQASLIHSWGRLHLKKYQNIVKNLHISGISCPISDHPSQILSSKCCCCLEKGIKKLEIWQTPFTPHPRIMCHKKFFLLNSFCWFNEVFPHFPIAFTYSSLLLVLNILSLIHTNCSSYPVTFRAILLFPQKQLPPKWIRFIRVLSDMCHWLINTSIGKLANIEWKNNHPPFTANITHIRKYMSSSSCWFLW